MESLNENQDVLQKESNILDAKLERRSFLQYAGAGAAIVALTAAGCKKDRVVNTDFGVTLDFKDDFGVLNYAYALEQLEAAFYIQVAAAPPSGFSAAEKQYFQDIQFHEIAHREFFKNALGTAAIGNLSVDFSSINFTDRSSVLNAAMAFEDLGVGAYNGAGVRLKNTTYLLAAGKIVSVEARHAAYVRDLISNGTFATAPQVTASNGLDMALTPDVVLGAAGKYIKTKINVINL
ncbi:ferritin-like domain-containing protein [Pedobacter sp. Hv1]|uniref:ferritin-like domain-containing protein n=1 Tax=Pedobacter sp. Hv1 TaxID=1740090 RepID=UPI0006D8C69C|nr:ferritin-like domain-containing protein [Pedobacter sp. Hv1]KQB98972.1 Tat (twin-arginine translocation) pathway signal sequence containing protein [Pedobacter sp. Hv1]